ncbi:glycosyl hydrolase family 18 protein [Chiayiivirga flava]|uniref:Poly(3-hydroxybutyrate) depolymerase/GH18 family chitinase n=1 Tax=Chiayiivirga flava TaxID=659595 RepID=A0A7W8DAE1_9GAMM|nr:glycosyl hydrolase family 18 protein [Chiayiivirga flava]MBB5209088.1 poly(3-hydroxybutyrate) depolymerase/GH18 family chitinase [Chiayiivirga flava]
MRAVVVPFVPALAATLGVALALSVASPAVAGGPAYEAQARSLVSGGQTRHYLLATPTAAPAGPLPLVISLHGDGGSGAGMRAALPLEAAAAGAAVFAYPDAAGGTFEYWNDAGRQREATFVTDLIAALDAELDLDTGRVYLAGFSGGATMANALGCRLGDAVVRKLGIHSGSLYPVQVAPGVNDFGYTGNGGVDCDLPGAMLVWGTNDATPGVDYATGQNIRDNHTATQQCEATTTPTTPAPCVAYAGCAQPVEWCAVAGLGHAVWNQAASAMWRFFAADASGPVDPPGALWGDGFEGGAAPAPTRWVGGYHVGYERNLYPVADIDFDAITHLMVGRVIPNADGTLARHFDIDNVNGPLWAQSAIDAAQAAGRKAILMVGGAGEIAGWRAAADDGTRAAFVANLLDAVDDFGADGLDIDWEPLDTQDHADVLALLQALRSARPGLLLTMPVMWINSNIEWNPRPVGEAAFLAAAAPLLDQVNVMTYEMAAAYEGWHSWFASPLYGEAANTPSSVESSVAYYRGAGVPAAKLGIGIGFYGNCFRGVSQPRVPVVPGNFVVSDGAMSYRNIVSSYAPAMTAHYDAVARAPWLGSAAMAGPSQCNLVTYENAASIAEKAAFVDAEGLGGTIIWTVGQGHLPDAPAGQRDPLLDAVREGFLE